MNPQVLNHIIPNLWLRCRGSCLEVERIMEIENGISVSYVVHEKPLELMQRRTHCTHTVKYEENICHGSEFYLTHIAFLMTKSVQSFAGW